MSAEIKRIKCFGHYYHTVTGRASRAVKDRLWRKEVIKRWGLSSFSGGIHHVAGRRGILRYMIENGCPLDMIWHAKEKSLNMDDRIEFGRYVRLKVGGQLYDRLQNIKQYITRINPKYRGD